MNKPNPMLLYSGIAIGLVLLGIVVFAFSCSKSSRPVITMALNPDGKPELEYSGPGVYTCQSVVDKFSLETSLVPGVRLTKVAGLLRRGDSNAVTIFLQSLSHEPYQIRLLGFHTNATTSVQVDQTSEILEIPAGTQKTNFDRFIIFLHKPEN